MPEVHALELGVVRFNKESMELCLKEFETAYTCVENMRTVWVNVKHM